MGIKPIPLFMLSAWIKAATKCGFNVQPLFKEAGIKIDLIRLEDARVSPLQLISLLEQCVAAKMGSVSSEEMIATVLASIDALLESGPIKDKEIAKNVYANAAFWNHRFTKNAEAAKRYAEMLKEVAGDDQRFAGLFKMINGDG